ncbi:G-protein beta WD-40 repeats containing protein [Reticulomyxa filosa]|uniref:G-protein beta WD-40 repeats containing protein n=1 Tax=Reticulomyxa filosa TaxID=46433 RepID=X6MVK6_RETFI|nr:G-protein beta WD-40 repeats containing protein [Reticulomyxa filosa]|eukprot:ETO17681.1 G-protein beta WD-40 repeats containing protein [Reticulomyxa filosa]
MTLRGHTEYVWSIDYSTFDDKHLLCSGSDDKTVRIWDIETSKQIQANEHLSEVHCVKFSPYHYYNHHRNVVCSSSRDRTIRFWDIKDNMKSQIFNRHGHSVCGIEFSSFNGGRYLCAASFDSTVRFLDIETSELLHVFRGHGSIVRCVEFSPLQTNNNNNGNKSNDIGIIGGNGYTICSGSWDNTIRIWDIETAKQLIVLKGHQYTVNTAKYGTNELGMIGGTNMILSGSGDKSIRLWDIRSSQQTQIFNGHTTYVYAAEYSPFVVKNIEVGGNSNVICSGSEDNTIRFWDIRSNNKELYVINGDKEGDGILCLKFLQLKKNKKNNNNCDVNLCYSSRLGPIRIWG